MPCVYRSTKVTNYLELGWPNYNPLRPSVYGPRKLQPNNFTLSLPSIVVISKKQSSFPINVQNLGSLRFWDEKGDFGH